MMRLPFCLGFSLSLAVFVAIDLSAQPAMEPGLVTLLVRFGLKDDAPTNWDGEARVTGGGQVARVEGWRFGREDKADGPRWTAATRPMMPNNPFQSRVPADQMPPADNGVLVTLSGTSSATQLEVVTAQGKFAFALADVPYGKTLSALDGKADVQRTTPTWQLTSASEEEDFPAAAAAADGTLYVAYIAFTHGQGQLVRAGITQMPEDFSSLAVPTGGERVLLKAFMDGQWSPPVEIAKGQDFFKCAVAVNAQSQPCVVWSEQRDGNFDLYASVVARTLRLTTDLGPDIAPVAATDSQGRVWIAWMAGRKDNFDIRVARLDGERLADEQTLGATPWNEWNPAIAASRDGEVAVAWETYAKGDYDVYLATAKGGPFGKPVPVAASARLEARPSVAYDGDRRLWVAWEEGDELWGKDSGALIKNKGAPLYRMRNVRLKVFVNGQPHRTVADINAARPLRPNYGPQVRGVNKAGAEPNAFEIVKPGPKAAQQPIPWDQPRLGADASGRVWLAFRSRSQNFPNSTGNAWYEHVTTCDGDRWLPAVHVHHTDNYLDNKPAFVSAAGGLLLVSASDGRHASSGLGGRGKWGGARPAPARPDGTPAVNNDLWVAEIAAGTPPLAPPKLEPVEPEQPSEETPATKAERTDVARMRAYRATVNGQELRLMRGEFHRHTELSQDGAGDGSLEDM
ncbi:MAG: hypothetical protein FJ279_30915, partial [Planctomycetes bacterium]|nr:hypothetical protein [Planctomycetota bacterium]